MASESRFGLFFIYLLLYILIFHYRNFPQLLRFSRKLLRYFRNLLHGLGKLIP